jgi:hypothetical protein
MASHRLSMRTITEALLLLHECDSSHLEIATATVASFDKSNNWKLLALIIYWCARRDKTGHWEIPISLF